METTIRIRYASRLAEDISLIYSDRLRRQIKDILNDLPKYPEMESANVRQSLVDRFGPHLRKIAISTFLLICRYEEASSSIDVLALVYGPRVH